MTTKETECDSYVTQPTANKAPQNHYLMHVVAEMLDVAPDAQLRETTSESS